MSKGVGDASPGKRKYESALASGKFDGCTAIAIATATAGRDEAASDEAGGASLAMIGRRVVAGKQYEKAETIKEDRFSDWRDL